MAESRCSRWTAAGRQTYLWAISYCSSATAPDSYMTKGLTAVIFLSALCACSNQDKPVTVKFRLPPEQADPQKALERSKQTCEAMGREFTLLEPPPHWRFSCEPHGVTSTAVKVK
jgi:hypothetical protein